jgi:PKD repeat protein
MRTSKAVPLKRCAWVILYLLGTIRLTAQIVPSFTINQRVQCIQQHQFVLVNTSTGANDATYKWDLGDGTFAASDTVVHQYATFGSYNITLVGTSKGVDYYSSQVVWVNPMPQVAFSILPNTQNGNSYTFLSSSSIPSGNIQFVWDFGDGTTSALSNPLKNYLSAGTYAVKLLVTSDVGCADSMIQTVRVTMNGKSFTAAFAINNPVQCLRGNDYQFTNQSTKDIGILYKWDFGDGTTSTQAHPSKTFTRSGQYIVGLTVYYQQDSIVTTQAITVNANPVAAFDFVGKNASDTTIQYINRCTTVSGYLNYQWQFGDGTVSTLSNPLQQFAQPGNYLTQLKVTDVMSGCSDSSRRNVIICPTLKAAIAVDQQAVCANNNRFVFTNTATNNAGLTTADITAQWQLGENASIATGNSTTYTYAKDGTYYTKLTVTYQKGVCKVLDSIMLPVVVYPAPKANYILYLDTKMMSGDSILQCHNAESDFSFINNSTIKSGIMQYRWSFGTGSIRYREGNALTANTRVLFTSAGNYIAKLTAISEKGCADSLVKPVFLSKPIASFTTTINNAGKPTNNPQITYTSNATDPGGTIAQYAWLYTNSEGAKTSTAAIVGPMQFTKGGVYTATLKVTSNVGCTATASKDTFFYVQPIAAFALNAVTFNNEGKAIVSVAANNSSVAETPVQLLYAWNFGDSTPIEYGILPNAHVYQNAAAKRTITLTVTNTNGGLVSIFSQTVATMLYQPTASFVFARTSVDNAALVVRLDGSSSKTNDAESTLLYDWDFGDGTARGSGAVVNHTYASGGKYTVVLTVTNTRGQLTHTVTKIVEYYITPIASLATNINYNNNKYSLPVVECSAAATKVNDAAGKLLYSWNFGDGNTATGMTAKYTYPTGGNKTIVLTVTNANGNTVHTQTQTINVQIVPKAQIAINFNPVNSYLTFYGNAAAAPSTIVSGTIVSYTWTFDYTWIPTNYTYVNWAGTFNMPSVAWAGSFTNWRITARLTVTSNLGVTETITAQYGGSTPNGYTAFKMAATSPKLATESAPNLLPASQQVLIKLFPNPVQDELHVDFAPIGGSNMHIMVFHADGRLALQQQAIAYSNATNSTLLNVHSLPPGNYQVVIKSSNGLIVANAPFVKTK